METMHFKTNINCSSCVAKVTPFMNELKSINKWMVDTQNADKILTIESNNLTALALKEQITKAGFIAEPIGNHEGKYHQEKEYILPFWKDTPVWNRASKNTLNCLVGCTVGDFGMMIFLQTYYHHMNMFLMMGLAMLSGVLTSIILETFILKIREKFAWSFAFKTAVGMSLLSMITMELAENLTDLALTDGNIPISDPYYWYALIPSILMGFLVPLPYNYYQLKKHGKSCH